MGEHAPDKGENCKCPFKVKFSKVAVTYPQYRTQGGAIRTSVKVDARIEFKLTNPEKCCCKDVHVVQAVGWFKLGGGFVLPDDPQRAENTVKTGDSAGWRIDWPAHLPIATPFIENTDYADWDLNSGSGWLNDPPEISEDRRKFRAHTCLICDHGSGYRTVIGCVSWGFSRDGGHESPKVTPEPAKPEVSCSMPQNVLDAIKQWNNVHIGADERLDDEWVSQGK